MLFKNLTFKTKPRTLKSDTSNTQPLTPKLEIENKPLDKDMITSIRNIIIYENYMSVLNCCRYIVLGCGVCAV